MDTNQIGQSLDASISTTQPQTIPPPHTVPPPQTVPPPPSYTPIHHEEEEVEVSVGSKRVRGKGSEVWEHAKRVTKKDASGFLQTVAICNYCQGEVPAHSKKHGNNGIKKHLEKCKANPHNVATHRSQPTLTQSSMTSALVPHTFNQKKLEAKVVEFVVRDEMPFRVVEGAGFEVMMKEAQPQFKIPNRKKVALLVWDLFMLEKTKIKSVICDQRVSITTDTWTSIQNINYMVVTAHFLDSDWKLHKRIINFTKITSHKGDDIGGVLEECLNEWGIKKVFTITVDNATSNDIAVSYMAKRLEDMGTLLFNGKYLHLRCTCHIINLIVKSGLKYLAKSIESIRNCVKYIHSSSTRLDQFRTCAILLKMDKMSTVPFDVPTRWNSTYTMLSIAYKFRKVFARMADESVPFRAYFNEEVENGVKRMGPPNEVDWDKAQAFVHYLKRFHDTTLRLSATKTVTSTLVWEDIVSIGTSINEAMDDITNPILQEVATSMKAKFNKYWGDIDNVNKLVMLGHILDPRYKFQMMGLHLSEMGLNIGEKQVVMKDLEKCLLDLYHAYKGNSSCATPSGNYDGDEVRGLMEMYGDDPIKLKRHLQITQLRKDQNQAEISNEVDKYLTDPFIKWDPTFNVLEWWKGNITTFPILTKIAKDIFAIPSSTVASESAFSLGRRVVDPFRASLQPKMVEALVCCSDWLRGEEINLYKEPTEEELQFYKDCEEVTNAHTLGLIGASSSAQV